MNIVEHLSLFAYSHVLFMGVKRGTQEPLPSWLTPNGHCIPSTASSWSKHNWTKKGLLFSKAASKPKPLVWPSLISKDSGPSLVLQPPLHLILRLHRESIHSPTQSNRAIQTSETGTRHHTNGVTLLTICTQISLELPNNQVNSILCLALMYVVSSSYLLTFNLP